MSDAISIDFTGVDSVPVGEALLAVTKAEKGVSNAGNKKIKVTLKVVEAEDPQFVGRILFDNWVLEGNAVWKTKQALDAFLGEIPVGPYSFQVEDLIGKQCWCLLEIETGEGEYANQKNSRVKRFGIEPTAV